MHHEVNEFLSRVRSDFPAYFQNTVVLDVGSRNVNGSCQWAFNDCLYTGIDIAPGKGVDIVADVIEYARLHESEYDVIVSTEMLEHDRHAPESMAAMVRLLRPRGLLVITCAGPERAEHGTHERTPEDSPATLGHYRNLSSLDFMEALGTGEMLWSKFEYGRGEQDCYFYGIKR